MLGKISEAYDSLNTAHESRWTMVWMPSGFIYSKYKRILKENVV